MSHFTVGVITHKQPDWDLIERILAPYDENLPVEIEYDDEDGNVYHYNPKAKWDWFDIGGRWQDELLHKDGERCGNSMQIKDIDFDAMTKRDGGIWRTFAMVDEFGWHECGQMGWFGCSDATDESTQEFEDYFVGYMNKEKNQDKYLTVVDCHI